MESENFDQSQVNYHVVMGVMDRAKMKPENFNDTELKTFFNATHETIQKLRDEEKPEIAQARLKLGEAHEGILEILEFYMDIPEDRAKLIALWILGTYFHEAFSTYPFMFINAMRGSGKTRLLKIIANLAAGGSGMVSTEPTEAVLYRTPKHSTLCFDEFEGIGGKERSTFRQYMNASYKKGGIVQRAKKVKKDKEENYEIEAFEPYKPIALANIWGMEEVLGDRCLTIILQKSANPSKTKKMEDFDINPKFHTIKQLMRTFSAASVVYVGKKNYIHTWNEYIHYIHNIHNLHLPTQPTLSKDLIEMFEKIDVCEIDGRNLELMFPLLIVAKFLSSGLFLEILEIMKGMMKEKKDEELAESKDVVFIDFIAQNYEPSPLRSNYVPIKEIAQSFKVFINEVSDVTEDKWIGNEWVGRALKRLDLALDKRRVARGNEVVLDVDKAREKMKMFKPEVKDETKND